MHTTASMNLTVTADEVRLIDELVASGEYSSQSEVIHDGLRLLAERRRAVETWLRGPVASTYDRVMSGASTSHSVEEARAILAARSAAIT